MPDTTLLLQGTWMTVNLSFIALSQNLCSLGLQLASMGAIFPKMWRLVIKRDGEVEEATNEEYTFVKAIDGGKSLALDRLIPGFCSRVELAPAVYSLPTSGAVARDYHLTLVVFLRETETNLKFHPVIS